MATARKKTKRRPEAAAQKTILETLQRLGYWCWRNNAGVMVVGTGSSRRVIRMAPTGSPDIVGILPGGKFFGLEVKAPGKKQSDGQLEWEEKSLKFGAHYHVVQNATEALKYVAHWARGGE